MGLHPPELQFTITVIIQQRIFLTKNGSGVWEEISRLEIGPRKKIALSDSHMVNACNVLDAYLALLFGIY